MRHIVVKLYNYTYKQLAKSAGMTSHWGRIPTFESKNGKSIIDVTLSYKMSYTIENWRVLRSLSLIHI